MASQSDDTNTHPWKRNAWQSRQAISEALIALPTHYPQQKAVNVSQYHEMAQKYLFEYHSVFEPKTDKFGGDIDPETATEEEINDSLWYEPISTVQVPVSGKVRLNGDSSTLEQADSNAALLGEVGDRIPTRQTVLRLATLHDLFQSNNTFQIQLRGWLPNQGTETQTITEQRYMPIAAIIDVRRQLDRCLEESGWLPNVTSTPRTEITDDLIEEVEEWRQQNLA